ncbi:transposon-transfer assisting family protein [Acutalibacter intestini]|uniref:transposon-transfer assisting family protein n=1 Tax=Acutalibacter intestini TaxID=3093659 RepID=UPI003F5827E2
MSNFLKASCSGAKNFFPLPNAIFSLGLSAGEIAVYVYLMCCEDRKSHQCWPSYKTIDRAVGMSENMVRKYEYKTLILTEPTNYESADGQVRNGRLTVEETNLLSIYNEGGKRALIENVNAALPYMDADMRELAKRTVSKVDALTEAEFAELPIYAADEV